MRDGDHQVVGRLGRGDFGIIQHQGFDFKDKVELFALGNFFKEVIVFQACKVQVRKTATERVFLLRGHDFYKQLNDLD